VQIFWIPFWAAGVINGVGHYWGYRNFETQDTSRNIWPFGVLIGGEEFHNNHHAYGSSAKFSSKWWELDIGWLYICALERLGLASVMKVAPRASFSRASSAIDLDTLRAVVTHRFYVLKLYGRRVIAPVLHGHAADEPSFPRRQLARVRKLMIREDTGLREDPRVRQWLDNAMERNHTVRTVYSFLQRLKTLCAQTTGKTESDLKRLQAWCMEAEASGIRVLGDFARQLQAYTPQPA
jgi:stearoyl-CoA desaturase (delta-9 desaturase)